MLSDSQKWRGLLRQLFNCNCQGKGCDAVREKWMHSKCLLQIMRQTNSCLNQTMSSLCSALLCSDVSRQRHTMRAKSRQDISALGGYRRLAGCLVGLWFLRFLWQRVKQAATWQRGSSRCGLQQFSAFSCLVFVFVFVFGFLFSVVFLLCFTIFFFYQFSTLPVQIFCATVRRWCNEQARGAGAGFVFMFRKSKFRYLQIAGQASLFPLAVLWPTFRFFSSLSLFSSVSVSACTVFLQ